MCVFPRRDASHPIESLDELGRDSFLKRLESARNRDFFFRLGLINLVHESPRMITVKNYFQNAHLRGHDAALYALAILEICGRKWEDIQKGSAFLHELWTNGCLLECRRQIEEARKIDGFWPDIRGWWSELQFGGVCYVHTVTPKVPILRRGITVTPRVHRFRKGVLVGSADGDYYYNATCVACLLNEEIKWFLENLGFQDPFL